MFHWQHVEFYLCSEAISLEVIGYLEQLGMRKSFIS